MFKILDSSFSLKQTEKKETRVETPGSLFKTELLKTLKLKKKKKKKKKEEEEEEEEEEEQLTVQTRHKGFQDFEIGSKLQQNY